MEVTENDACLISLETSEVQSKKNEIKNKEYLLSVIQQQTELCTLSVRHSTKTIVVSWCLGNDLLTSSTSWIGLFKLNSPNDKYIVYIATGMLDYSDSELIRRDEKRTSLFFQPGSSWPL